MDRLKPYTAEIAKFCKTYNVKSLYAFGSVLTDDFTSDSDIDLIVDFAPINVDDYADN